jgi:hypothetical protein
MPAYFKKEVLSCYNEDNNCIIIKTKMDDLLISNEATGHTVNTLYKILISRNKNRITMVSKTDYLLFYCNFRQWQ